VSLGILGEGRGCFWVVVAVRRGGIPRQSDGLFYIYVHLSIFVNVFMCFSFLFFLLLYQEPRDGR